MHTAAIRQMPVDAAGRLALSVSYDKTARLWELPSGRLIRVLPEWSTAKRTVHAVYPSRRLPAKARAFVDFLHARLPHAPGVELPTSEAS